MNLHKIALQASHEFVVDPVLAQEKRDKYLAAAAAEETARHVNIENYAERTRLEADYLQKKTASDADPSNPALAAATAEAYRLFNAASEEHARTGLDYQIKYTSMCRAMVEYNHASYDAHGISPIFVPLYRECKSYMCLCPRTSNGSVSCILYPS